MSCYEYQYGTLKLSTKEFSRVRRAFAESYNAWLDANFNKALELYEPIKEHIAKNKKNKELYKGYRNPVYNIATDFLQQRLSDVDETTFDKIFQSLVSIKNVDGKSKTTIVKPTKKSFKHVSLSENEYSDSAAYVRFYPDTKEFNWRVDENNHSVDQAWINILGRTFKKVFSKVEWTRGTGGVFFYNSEYNRENEGYDGAGGDRASHYFGPIGEKYKKDILKPLRYR